MSLSLDPAIELPDENEEEYYPGFEPNSQLLIAGADWIRAFKKNKREISSFIKVFGENIDGMSVFICRFLIPQ